MRPPHPFPPPRGEGWGGGDPLICNPQSEIICYVISLGNLCYLLSYRSLRSSDARAYQAIIAIWSILLLGFGVDFGYSRVKNFWY